MAQFRSIIFIAVIGLVVLFSGCTGTQTPAPTATPTVTAVTATPIAEVTTPEQYSSSNVSISNSINDFTFKTYSLLSKDSGNLFFSSFSISTALSMAAEGAGGKTLEEMRNILGLSNDPSANRKGFESLLNNLNAKNAGYNLSIADAVWIEKTFSVKQEFSNALSTYYHALAQQADFANNPDGERTNINNWVAGKTNNKILDLIPQGGLDSLTRLVIVDAIYFKGNWAQQFDKNDTQNTPFFISPSKNVSVPLMHLSKSENASYYSDNEIKALEMDYQGDNLSMLIQVWRKVC